MLFDVLLLSFTFRRKSTRSRCIPLTSLYQATLRTYTFYFNLQPISHKDRQISRSKQQSSEHTRKIPFKEVEFLVSKPYPIMHPATKVPKLNEPIYTPTPLYSFKNASYSLFSISPSNSLTSLTLIFAIHPSFSGLLLIKLGLSASFSFASTIVPETGAMISDADLTDSTAPKASPTATSVSAAGSSTKTTSPRDSAAKVVMPIVAAGEVSGAGKWREGERNRCQRCWRRGGSIRGLW